MKIWADKTEDNIFKGEDLGRRIRKTMDIHQRIYLMAIIKLEELYKENVWFKDTQIASANILPLH